MRFAGVTVEQKVPCRMRDGITLYSDVYRPSEDGEYPVLLMRQLYGRAIASTVTSAHPVWYAQQGYVVIIQDVRGRGDSEGNIVFFEQEVNDGYDTVEWAAQLPGTTGKVGMYGFSYQGSTQWAAAAAKPPHLAAIAPGMCAADLYNGRFYPHGRFAWGGQLGWAFQVARDGAMRAGDKAAEEFCARMMRSSGDLLWKMPLAEEHPVLKKYCPFFYDWLAHPRYDEYWAERNWIPAIAESSIPAFLIGGWYDTFLNGTLQTYEALQNKEQSRDCFYKMLIGPWTHIPWGRKAGGVDHGSSADGNVHVEQLRWFDYWLKGSREHDPFNESAVRYYERESQEWRTTEKFPFQPEDSAMSSWYLSSSEKPANGALGGGELTKNASEIVSVLPDVFVYDARLPMNCESYVPADRSMIQDRYEILSYTSQALTENLNALGSPKVQIHYQTLQGPTDMVAILSMVMPGGAARFLSVGRTEVYSEGGADDGQWKKVEFAMRPFAAQFVPGTALRLELTGSAFPLMARHPNGVGTDELHQTGSEELNIATVAVFSNQEMVSSIELPVIRLEVSAGHER
jgi:putative CocE/NonD family hydrolase